MLISTPKRAFSALLLVNLIWGVGFVVVDDAINVMRVDTFNAFRFFLATLALIPLWYFKEKKSDLQKDYKILSLLKTGALLGFILFIAYSMQTQGMLYTSVSNTGFITGMCVPLVPIIGLLIYKTKVANNVWIGVLITVCGLYFLTVGDKLALNSGDILVAIAAVCFASHIAIIARVVDKFPVVALCIVQMSFVAIYSTVAASFQSFMEVQSSYPPLLDQLSDFNLLAAIAYSGLLASALAFWAQSSSQLLIEPHKVAMIFATEPIFGYIAAFIVLGEILEFSGMLGASLIIAGMIYSEIGGRRKINEERLEPIAVNLNLDLDLHLNLEKEKVFNK